jgi:predicted transcriptional regulator
VREKLRTFHEEIAANREAPAAYTVRQAIEDSLQDGLDSRSEATITKYRYVLAPVTKKIGRAALRELTANDVRRALTSLAKEQSTAGVAIAHNALTRAIRRAESRMGTFADGVRPLVPRPSRA